MEQLKVNLNNKKYYSEDFIRGFECGVRRQFEVDKKEGKWIYIDEPIMGNPYGRYRCSECELEEPHETDYCPNCGARMDK